ncbi:MAG TPA: YebC/PmpR family DNA-binding transcriptional regulator [Herpetosiphonaceae bacterium]|jgi:YebC/PmpR family DNA-binding regulatory protein|nr:YebC/PmpR family DNA-binding transcriptional regulator [Herpetosiphonaceae bacterium]
MSGHSKWHSIRRSKGVLDQRRGAVFTKIAREITVAAKEGGGDPEMNFRLRLAVDKAKQANMPGDNIQRAIDRATGKGGEAAIDELYYEGYAPGGVALIVHAATDNRNRTAAEVRAAFTKGGGNLGETGSVAWMFEPKGLITIEMPENKPFDPDEVMLQAIDAGADDVLVDDHVVEVYTEFTDLNDVRLKLVEAGLPVTTAERLMKAKTPYTPPDKDALSALRLMERLEDLDDVQKVYSNIDVTDELADKFAASV